MCAHLLVCVMMCASGCVGWYLTMLTILISGKGQRHIIQVVSLFQSCKLWWKLYLLPFSSKGCHKIFLFLSILWMIVNRNTFVCIEDSTFSIPRKYFPIWTLREQKPKGMLALCLMIYATSSIHSILQSLSNPY